MFCWRPNCLVNGGRCTGIRFVPDPSIPEDVVPVAAQVGMARAVREEVKRELKDRAPSDFLTERAVRDDIARVRAGWASEFLKPGEFTP